MKFLNYFTQTFGFQDFYEFFDSLVHTKFLLFTLPSAAVCFGVVSQWFGFTPAIFASFVILAILELVTGLVAARIKGQKWESKKMSRFGLKIFVYLSLMFVTHSFSKGFDIDGLMNQTIHEIFDWLGGTLIVYVSFEYLISVLENLAVITGKSNNKLLSFIKRKFDGFLGDSEKSKENDVKNG